MKIKNAHRKKKYHNFLGDGRIFDRYHKCIKLRDFEFFETFNWFGFLYVNLKRYQQIKRIKVKQTKKKPAEFA